MAGNEAKVHMCNGKHTQGQSSLVPRPEQKHSHMVWE